MPQASKTKAHSALPLKKNQLVPAKMPLEKKPREQRLHRLDLMLTRCPLARTKERVAKKISRFEAENLEEEED